MSCPLRITYPGAFYHITSRGNERKQIFKRLAEFIQQPALVKNVSLYLCHRHTAISLKQIGRYFNVGQSAVSQASRRVRMKIKRDKKLKKRIKRVENRLNLSRV